MKKITLIQLKAAFLFLLFGLNTMVGFACSIGVGMGFNPNHHDEEAIEVHVHANGTKHVHHKEINKHHHDKKENSKKDDCCNDKVIKLSQSDKSIPQSNILINPGFFSVFISSYYNIEIFYRSQVTTSVRYFVRSYHPPIPDIRIAIQSFQI